MPKHFTFPRTRRFFHNHPVAITATLFTVGFVVGSRTCANQYQEYLRELDPSGKLIEKFFDTGEV
jgi:hypothetical protein